MRDARCELAESTSLAGSSSTPISKIKLEGCKLEGLKVGLTCKLATFEP